MRSNTQTAGPEAYLDAYPAATMDVASLMLAAMDNSVEAGLSNLRLLIADDQIDVLEALRLLLKAVGCKVQTADSPAGLLRAVGDQPFDLILMDMNYSRDTTSGQEGLHLLDQLRAHGVAAPIVVMTAWGDVELAVEAMRRGAADFVQKPWDNTRLVRTLENQARTAARLRRVHEREKSDLDIARKVQQNLFPHRDYPLRTIAYAGCCVPASAVGGDYYDYFPLGDRQVGFVLADVSGKGVSAALLMSNLQAMFRSQAKLAPANAPALLESVNQLFYGVTEPERYATLFFARYDDETRRLRYINCGHTPPFLLRAGGSVERLDPTAMVIGLVTDWTAGEGEVQLAPGDVLVIVSDGVTEAGMDGDDEEFGESRLVDLLQANRNETPPVLIERVIDAVRDFSSVAQGDDITVVAIQALAG
jgi:phosphoserine phosphatase RsbU/P